MANVVKTFQNIFKIEELRSRLLVTLLILLVVRVGTHITLPGVNVKALEHADPGTLFGLFDLFVGGAFSKASIFALGIMPYITSSIIFQLAGIVFPQIQKMQREGEEGRRKINQYTRMATVLISALQGWGVALKLSTPTSGALPAVPDPSFLFFVSCVVLLSAGTVILMWLGEQITESGLGNGISLIIFIGIIARLPSAIYSEILMVIGDGSHLVTSELMVKLIIAVILIGIIAAVILVTQGARRIPVQYAKRVVGQKVYGGTTQYIPLRVNTAGVMPIIFAQSIMFIPNTVLSFFPESPAIEYLARMFSDRSLVYGLIYGAIIIFFTYFYTAIVFNPKDIADNMKKNGGFIPGIRPGKPTADYIETVLTRITLPGSVFLAIIAILPTFVTHVLNVTGSFASFFGGTSLLIMIGVALDTLQQIESYLLMRQYDGFMKSGKIKGRVGSGGF